MRREEGSAKFAEAPQTPAVAQAEAQHAESDDDRVKASPLAKSMAKSRGIDINRVQGSGPKAAS
ncbi:MAG: E3 binding domain-containing protein [Bacteroidetes bacterium]|nr:E3 binding domain-containing protein [Bacteroidota bacterium]